MPIQTIFFVSFLHKFSCFFYKWLNGFIIILYTESSISTYLHHHLITGKYGIIKKQTKEAISGFNWDMAFQNKDTNEKNKILNETLLNIFNNFISNKISSFDYKNAVWMNKRLHCF